MTATFQPRVTGRTRPIAAAFLCGLLVTTAGACTAGGDAAPPAVEKSASVSATAVPSATVEARPAPLNVRVTRVAGRMRPNDRAVLADKVGSVLATYFDDAFLGGEYPRDDFDDAFATFSAGAAEQAKRDRDLLTNSTFGPTTDSVVARRQSAYLSVLAPAEVAAGVTARVALRFSVDRGEKPAKEITVKGRLMLTRTDDGGWKIFGYDLSQSASTVGEGS